MKLSVPQKSITIEAGVELRPAQVRRWLQSLPVLDVVENMNKILAALHAVNRNPVKPEVRFRLLEEYRDPVGFITNELRIRLKILSLPLSEKNRRLTEAARLLEQEMAVGYKNVVVEMQKRVAPGQVDEIYLTAVHRALRHTTRQLMRCYEYYTPIQPELWTEVHQLYGLAAALGVADRPVPDNVGNAVHRTTVAHAYKHALLLGLSGPYQQPFHMINKIDTFLEWWADSARLVPYPGNNKKKCQFTVEPNQDRPGVPFTSQRNSQDVYVLDTRPLVREVHLQLTAMTTGVVPNKGGLSRDFYDETARNMLRRLVVCWGINPTRRFNRITTEGPIELALGTEAVNWHLNGEKEFELCSQSRDQEIHMSGVGGFSTNLTRTQPPPKLQSWQICDESACGFGLYCDGSEQHSLRVGDLVVLRQAGTDREWQVGLVRWVRSATGERLEIGIQKLAPGATPVAVQPVSVDDSAPNDYRLGVLLPELPAMNQPRTLITPKGAYQAQRNLFLDNGETLQMIRAGSAIEESATCDWFEFTVHDI